MSDTKDISEFKYIDIPDWDEKQNAPPGSPWIKDYVDKEGAYAYSMLTAYQRYVLDGLHRLRARMAQRIHNDSTYIARALCMLRTDRPHVAHTIRTLYSHGLLTLWNEPLHLQSRVEKNRDRVEVEKNISIATVNDCTNFTSLDSATLKDKYPLAETLAKEWFRLMESNTFFDKKYLPKDGNLKLQIADLSRLLEVYDEIALREVLAFSQTDGQMKTNWRTDFVLDHHSILFDKLKVLKRNPGVWSACWNRYCSIVGYSPSLPQGAPPASRDLAVLDESKATSAFKLDDDDDEYV